MHYDDVTGSCVVKFCLVFPNVGGGPSGGVMNLRVTERGEICPLGRILSGLVRVVMFPSRLRAALDAVLVAWDGMDV